jgi:hypothetical protein
MVNLWNAQHLTLEVARPAEVFPSGQGLVVPVALPARDEDEVRRPERLLLQHAEVPAQRGVAAGAPARSLRQKRQDVLGRELALREPQLF